MKASISFRYSVRPRGSFFRRLLGCCACRSLILCAVVVSAGVALGDEVPLTGIVPSEKGTMEIRVDGQEDHYYILYRSLDLAVPGEIVDLALGTNGSVVLRDRFAPRPSQVFYRVRQVRNSESEDADGDGRSDVAELTENIFHPGHPRGNAFNPVKDLRGTHGGYVLTNEDFEEFSVRSTNQAGVNEGIAGQRFMKFIGMPDWHPAGPAVFFMNSHRYRSHGAFLNFLDENYAIRPEVAFRGELAWIPESEGEGDGWYTFNLQPGDLPGLAEIRQLYQILTKNMPFIDGNLAYRPWDSSLIHYLSNEQLREQLDREGIPVWLDHALTESERYAPMNEGETYGLLRVFEGDERPSILDVALYRSLPNDVPLVRGIITESPQTPLSHVNLRAVQNQNPNAFIEDASTHPVIAPLIGKYVHYAVRGDGFEIKEATKEEVDAHFAALRPSEPQNPPRNILWNQSIQPLEQLGFEKSSSIGAKAANLAEMISSADELGIPPEVFPPFGYAVPFYFYDEFMRHNGFYSAAETMMAGEGFADDLVVREEALRAFRKQVRGGSMPRWMIDELSEVQQKFALVGGIRCRSSTNNEDLPGFNGAGLYGSYTHYPDEGHLSKSVKQVYASLWTFIAFEHREFYRVNHLKAAMGVLMHPNYQDEKANGVAVSRYDLISVRSHPYYANVQVGEDLVTNPEIDSRPEELLLSLPNLSRAFGSAAPIRLAASNQVPWGTIILSDAQAQLLGIYLQRIVSHFSVLYREQGNFDFAMEIEFKITEDDQLVIKQARPWVN